MRCLGPCLVLLILPFLLSCSRLNEPHYDVAIVGGGLAGLSAADGLRGLKVVVIEKNERLGGRVWTKYWKDTPYELGALFGYSPEMLQPGMTEDKRVSERGPLGFSSGGKIYLGESVAEAFSKYTDDESVLAAIRQASSGAHKRVSRNDLPEDVRKILGSLFNLIHPGESSLYIPQRQADAFVRFNTDHYSRGNGGIVTEISNHANSTIMTGTEAVAVVDDGSGVRIEVRRGGGLEMVHARKAIVAAPATVANRIIRTKNPDTGRFLSNVRYGEGIVVVFGSKDPDILPFSYIVTADHPFNSVFQSRTEDGIRILTIYYISDQTRKMAGKSMKEIIALTRAELGSIGIGWTENSEILFSDGHRWDDLGTIISEETYLNYDPKWLRASKNVYLAGDYTFWNKRHRMPYGMQAAAESGRAAAEQVKKQLGAGK